MKILIYNSGGGIGDSIQLFDIILTLKNNFSKDEIYYLSAHDNHFNQKLLDFNLKVKPLITEIKYFGFRIWHFFYAKKILKKNLIENFDLIIDLQSKLRNTFILRQFPHKNFYSSTLNFKFCTKKNQYLHTKHNIQNVITNLEKILGYSIPFYEYKIDLINKKYFDEAKKLLPQKNYIGFSITQGNEYRKKSWPIKNFINLANEISKLNKTPVFFIEKDNKDLINYISSSVKGAIFPETQSSLSGPPFVTALASRLEKSISIDNGIMHMIALAKIPMIVLFGPTSSEKFSPKHNNVSVLDSKKIYNSSDISKITLNDVLKHI
jgi:ADP-heptose:LPS heptosyltransferase